MSIPVLYQDDDIIIVEKPSGIAVHASDLYPDKETCLTIVRDTVGRYVYPVHRLDRATSGVLLLALNKQAAQKLCADWPNVQKVYHAVVRGWPVASQLFTCTLADERGVEQIAVASFQRLCAYELPVATKRFPTTRFALVEARPTTGRTHQLRRQLRRLNHPIIGDTTYGDNWHNQFGRRYGMLRLMLHATKITFQHPTTNLFTTCQSPANISNNLSEAWVVPEHSVSVDK